MAYLIHFNARHDPKTGRFDFALGPDKKQKYGGEKRSAYKKNMASKYQEEGFKKGQSRRLANYAANSNEIFTEQYNRNLNQYQRHQKKALAAYDKHDEKKYEKNAKKLIEAYRWAKISESMLSKDYELGKANYEPLMLVIAKNLGAGVAGAALGFPGAAAVGAIAGGTNAIAAQNKKTNKWTKSDSQSVLLNNARRNVTNDMRSIDKSITISKLENFLYGDFDAKSK